MAFCHPFPIVWRYCMVLSSVVCYCMVILWHYIVYHVGIEWYCMMLQWSSTLIYQLRAQGHKIKSLYHDIVISTYSIEILELKTTWDLFFCMSHCNIFPEKNTDFRWYDNQYHHQIILLYHNIVILTYSIKFLGLQTTWDIFFFHAQVRNANCYCVTHQSNGTIQSNGWI